MAHIVLPGDTIFDNAPYVAPGTHVQAQLQSRLAPQDRVSLPEAADWLVVSCGGNAVLDLVGAMQTRVGSVIEAATLLADWQAQFRRDYRHMLMSCCPGESRWPWRPTTMPCPGSTLA